MFAAGKAAMGIMLDSVAIMGGGGVLVLLAAAGPKLSEKISS